MTEAPMIHGEPKCAICHSSLMDGYRKDCGLAECPHLRRAGMVLVPKEPTRAMLKAASKAMSQGRRPTPERVSVKEKHKIRYRAMIAAYEEESNVEKDT